MKTETLKLKNGIRVAIVPLKGLKSVTVEVFLKIGSKYERSNEFGISHFLEHMAFKGTVKRPTAIDINREIDSKGANYNASTSQEVTSYYISTTRENVSWATELLSDMLINSVFDKDEVLKERGVIIEEIKMYQDNPMIGLSSELIKFLYGKSPIGCWDIAGEVKDIKDVNRDKVINYRNRLINPENIVVVLAGDVDSGAFGEVGKYFGGFDLGKSNKLDEVKIILNKEKEKKIVRQVEQGHFAMAVPALKSRDKRRYTFRLLDIILNGNSSSRLYQKIREDKGLAYYVESISESFEEVGFWGVQSGVRSEKIDEAMEIVRKEILSVKDTLKMGELQRAKDYLTGKVKLAMDRTSYWSSLVGQKWLLEDELMDIEKELKKYQEVSLKEISSLADEIFRPEEIRQVLIVKK